jgi:prevent-host-death family protein
MSRTLPVSAVKARLTELVADAEARQEEVVVTRNGRPAAVLVSFDEYERLIATLDVLSDPELMRQVRAARRHLAHGGRGPSVDDVFGESLE